MTFSLNSAEEHRRTVGRNAELGGQNYFVADFDCWKFFELEYIHIRCFRDIIVEFSKKQALTCECAARNSAFSGNGYPKQNLRDDWSDSVEMCFTSRVAVSTMGFFPEKEKIRVCLPSSFPLKNKHALRNHSARRIRERCRGSKHSLPTHDAFESSYPLVSHEHSMPGD